VKPPTYLSGEEIKSGDRISFHGEPGEVEFVVTDLTGDASMDWYVEEHPGGGVMISAEGFGSVFLPVGAIDERVEFVSRSEGQQRK
jgi:hypothetical protein